MFLKPIFTLILTAGILTTAHAAESVQLSPEGAAALEKGLALQQQATELRAQADTQLEAESRLCQKKFLVNDCITDAKARHLENIRAARQMDAEGRELEYQARQEERALKEQQRAGRSQLQEAGLPERQAEREAHRTEMERRAAQKQADKAAKAAERKATRERKQAKQRKKQNPEPPPEQTSPQPQ